MNRPVGVLALALALVSWATVAQAQTVVDPRLASFLPSPDHDATTSDGQPILTSYELQFFLAGGSQVILSVNLGKPAPGADGSITVDFASMLSAPPLPGELLESQILAIGPGGSAASARSNAFMFSACATVSPANVSVGSGGGASSVTVNAASQCSWRSTSAASWITITAGANGVGNGTVTFDVAANSVASRSGTLTIGGQTVTVTQAAGLAITDVSASPGSPAAVGTSIRWTATASGGTAPLQYKFHLYDQATATWTVLQDYAASNQVNWTPSVAGTYTIQVWVRSAGSTASWEAWRSSSAFTVTAPAGPSISSITPTPPSPVTVGTAVTWTAVASGGTAPLQYKFWLYNVSTAAWAVLQEYATNSQVRWTPSATGTYQVQVWVRSAGSTASYDAWLASSYFTVNPSSAPPLTIGSLTPAPASPVTVGTAVTWTAAATGGTAPLQYKFYLYNVGTAAWAVLQDYATSSQVQWTPTAAGTYQVQVWVRSAGSTASYDAWRASSYFTVNPSSVPPLTITSLGSAPASPVSVGTAVTWTAAATGGVAPLQYKFWLYNVGTAAWAVLQDYATSNQARWTPTVAGTYQVQVWVRSAGSTASYDAWRSSTYFTVNSVSTAPTITSISSNPAPPVIVGTPMTWTVAATGGVAPLQYKFYLYNEGTAAWTLLRDYATGNQASWTPTTAGAYHLQIWVRSAGSTAAYDAWGNSPSFSVVAANGASVLSVYASPVSPAAAGTAITWRAVATGGTLPRQYKFWLYNLTTGASSVLRDYSTSNQATWVPTTAGNYQVQVWVRSAGSALAYEAFGNSGTYVIQ